MASADRPSVDEGPLAPMEDRAEAPAEQGILARLLQRLRRRPPQGAPAGTLLFTSRKGPARLPSAPAPAAPREPGTGPDPTLGDAPPPDADPERTFDAAAGPEPDFEPAPDVGPEPDFEFEADSEPDTGIPSSWMLEAEDAEAPAGDPGGAPPSEPDLLFAGRMPREDEPPSPPEDATGWWDDQPQDAFTPDDAGIRSGDSRELDDDLHDDPDRIGDELGDALAELSAEDAGDARRDDADPTGQGQPLDLLALADELDRLTRDPDPRRGPATPPPTPPPLFAGRESPTGPAPAGDDDPAGRAVNVHPERIDRRPGPIRMTPSEALALAEEGPEARRRGRRGPEDG